MSDPHMEKIAAIQEARFEAEWAADFINRYGGVGRNAAALLREVPTEAQLREAQSAILRRIAFAFQSMRAHHEMNQPTPLLAAFDEWREAMPREPQDFKGWGKWVVDGNILRARIAALGGL